MGARHATEHGSPRRALCAVAWVAPPSRQAVAFLADRRPGWDLIEYNTPFVQEKGASVGSFLTDRHTVFVRRQKVIPAALGTALQSPRYSDAI